MIYFIAQSNLTGSYCYQMDAENCLNEPLTMLNRPDFLKSVNVIIFFVINCLFQVYFINYT